MEIITLKPTLTRAQALRMLKGPVREARRGRLQAALEFYVPYRLFQVAVKNGDRATESLLALDAVTGNLDLYAFESRPSGEHILRVESERIAPALLDEARAVEILRERVRRQVYLKGFFRVKGLEINCQRVDSFSIPYWVGIYRRQEHVQIEAIDAYRQQFEGAKLREVVAAWFASA